MDRRLAAATIAAVVLAFFGGFILAKGFDGTLFARHAPGGGALAGEFWPFFGHPRDAGAPRAGETKPAGFTVWKTRLDTSGSDPRACIQMTRDLDSSKSYADFVLVSPDLGHAPAVSAQGDTLCVGGVGFTDRQITLLKGLTQTFAQRLSVLL